MFVSHIDEIEKIELKNDALKDVLRQRVIGPKEGWDGHVMRVFTLRPGGHTPKHSHPWPHINYILEGEGSLYHGGETSRLNPGSVAYLPGGTEHQFQNSGDSDFVFICIVPEEGDK